VLAGDPKQLGAVTRSPVVQKLGLGKSLQEHLMETCSIYQGPAPDEPDARRCITRLCRNYR
jgi:hypothetical protein